MAKKSKQKNGGGRPTKLTSDVHNTIIEAVRAGNYLETAAASVGIDKTTLHDWLRRGAREPDGTFGEFSHSVKKALAEAEMSDLGRLQLADEWQAVAWRLERRNYERWGRKDRLSIKQEDPFENMTDEELANAIAAELLNRRGAK